MWYVLISWWISYTNSSWNLKLLTDTYFYLWFIITCSVFDYNSKQHYLSGYVRQHTDNFGFPLLLDSITTQIKFLSPYELTQEEEPLLEVSESEVVWFCQVSPSLNPGLHLCYSQYSIRASNVLASCVGIVLNSNTRVVQCPSIFYF